MLLRSGNRKAGGTRQPVTPVTPTGSPNAGRYGTDSLTARPWSRATDDVIVSHVGWAPWAATADHVAHRPDATGDRPACCAAADHWSRIGAYRAQTHMMSPCRERQCFPQGWAA